MNKIKLFLKGLKSEGYKIEAPVITKNIMDGVEYKAITSLMFIGEEITFISVVHSGYTNLYSVSLKDGESVKVKTQTEAIEEIKKLIGLA